MEFNVYACSMGIKGILYEFKYGNKVICDQVSSYDVL